MPEGSLPDLATAYDNDELVDYRGHDVEKSTENDTYYKQYSLDANQYYPISIVKPTLPAGLYVCKLNNAKGYYAEKTPFSMQGLLKFEDSITTYITEEFNAFWGMKDTYIRRGEHHKRGYLLWGPPGGGKTSLVTQLIQDFVKDGNIAFLFTPFIKEFLKQFREIEPERKILIIIEDIDAWFEYEGEQEILSFLDGESPLVNTVVIATTNYPEKLPDRIKNRPSRFDHMAEVLNPCFEHRIKYFENKTETLKKDAIEQWAKDTEGFSFAHLKELVLSVEVYKYTYEESLDRLKAMSKGDSSSADYEASIRGKKPTGLGFGIPKNAKPLRDSGRR